MNLFERLDLIQKVQQSFLNCGFCEQNWCLSLLQKYWVLLKATWLIFWDIYQDPENEEYSVCLAYYNTRSYSATWAYGEHSVWTEIRVSWKNGKHYWFLCNNSSDY